VGSKKEMEWDQEMKKKRIKKRLDERIGVNEPGPI